jgi:CRP/FNR family cyclic AMP-dependent transcriptional regulator
MPNAEELATIPLLAGLGLEQRDKLAALSHTVTFAAGHRLFDEGRPADACWLIRSGQVALDTVFPGAGRTVIQTLGAGDVLGWSWLVEPYRWRFGAVAVEDVEAFELDAAPLRDLLCHDPSLGCPVMLGLFQALLSRLESTRARVLDLYGSPRER